MRPRRLTIGVTERSAFPRTNLYIPVDVIFQVIDELIIQRHPRAFGPPADVQAVLLSLCLVNKEIGTFANKHLYQHVILPTDKTFFRFVDTVTAEEPKSVLSLALQCRPWVVNELYQAPQNILTSLRLLLRCVAHTLRRLDVTVFAAAPSPELEARPKDVAHSVFFEEVPRFSQLEEFSNVSDYYDIFPRVPPSQRRGMEPFPVLQRLVLYDPCWGQPSGCIRGLPETASLTMIFLHGVLASQGGQLRLAIEEFCPRTLREVRIVTLYNQWTDDDRMVWDTHVFPSLQTFVRQRPQVSLKYLSLDLPEFGRFDLRQKWALDGIRDGSLWSLKLAAVVGQ